MDMRSFVVKVKDFLLMVDDYNNKLEGKQYVIPKYQREYKWTEERIKTLIDDIYRRDKFLGNIMLNKTADCYEIVDGQQRITTIILILVALFNLYGDSGETELNEEQKNIFDYIFKDGKYILKNESVGEYLTKSINRMDIDIDLDNDIYFQCDIFKNRYNKIEEHLSSIFNGSKTKEREFEEKLLDCEILVLIGNTKREETTSIESIFLDVNYKAQLLDVSDIFKGYCFKIYNTKNHKALKEQWTRIRRRIKDFEALGYKETARTSQYLYYYLLSSVYCYESGIQENLSLYSGGPHYLDDKSETETKKLLTDIDHYGKHIIDFIDKLDSTSYIFDDICSDAAAYATDKKSHKVMRKMLEKILVNTKLQYYKLPIFMIIHYLYENENFYKSFSFKELKSFVTNYYIYSFFFIQSGRKSKESIDKTIFKELYRKVNTPDDAKKSIAGILKATKNLRKQSCLVYQQFKNYDKERLEMFYSILDNYNARNHFLNCIYSELNCNTEHLLIHNNTDMKVDWKYGGDNKFTFKMSDFFSNIDSIKPYRKRTSNFLILDSDLNEDMGHADIVSKVTQITEYYKQKGVMPRHIDIILKHVKQTSAYKELEKLKEKEFSEDTKLEIQRVYAELIGEYFDEEYQQKLYTTLENELKKVFQNNKK